MREILSAMLLTALSAVSADFSWQGQLSPGQVIDIQNIHGAITATGVSGNTASVTATKTGTNSDPNGVTIQVVPFDGGVLMCAIYPDPAPKHTNSCTPKGSDLSANNNDVVVDFTISVPQGVLLSAHTLIGDVNATSLTAAAEARVLQGTITISTSDSAEANDSRGSINAAIGATNWNGTSAYSAHNGSIDVTIPSGANVEVEASAFFGAIISDFPLTISSTTGGHSTMATGTLGSGGRVLKLSTFNGNINLHKGQ